VRLREISTDARNFLKNFVRDGGTEVIEQKARPSSNPRRRTETKGGSVSFVFLCALGGKGLALGLPKIARQA